MEDLTSYKLKCWFLEASRVDEIPPSTSNRRLSHYTNITKFLQVSIYTTITFSQAPVWSAPERSEKICGRMDQLLYSLACDYKFRLRILWWLRSVKRSGKGRRKIRRKALDLWKKKWGVSGLAGKSENFPKLVLIINVFVKSLVFFCSISSA